jgi:hypothetical protein
MTWVAWRQQRTESLLGVALLALIAILLVPTGLQMASAFHHDHLSACLGADPGPTCSQALDSFHQRFESIAGLTGWLTLLPGLVGVMLAAPFVLQLENGTYRLDWTQSITRGRWVVSKLALAIGGAVIFSAALVALATWWRGPLVRLDGRMETSAFDSQGVVVFGYTLFALGLGLAIGVLWRRAVAALVVAFIAYFVARLFCDTWLRQRLVPPESLTWAGRGNEPAALKHAWIINVNPSDKYGHATPLGRCMRPIGDATTKCVIHGPSYMHAIFEPASRFWTMQLAEFGLFGGAAVVLIGLAAWWTNWRTV